MAVIGNVPSSGASIILNLDYLPERLLLGELGGFGSFSNFSVVSSGVQLMSVTSEARFAALAKFDNQLYQKQTGPVEFGAEVSQYLRLAVGRINKQSTIQGTDGSAPANYPYPVQAASTGISNMARRAVESSINPSANGTFENFEALFISQTNFLRAQLTFDNGFTDEYTPAEVEALFVAFNQSDTNGGLNVSGQPNIICLAGDTSYGRIAQAVIYATSGGSVTVLKSDYVVL